MTVQRYTPNGHAEPHGLYVLWTDYAALEVERNQYREKTARAWLALKQVLGHIHAANEGGLITDTIWYDMHTTLVEYVEHEIDALDA